MRKFLILMAHLLVTPPRLMKPGGAKAIVAENLLLKQQLLAACRTRRRAPHVPALDRLGLGFWSVFLNARRRARAAILLKLSTLRRFHAALAQRKYYQLYTSHNRKKPGPKGPFPRADSRHRRYETTQPALWLSTDRPANHCPTLGG